MKTIVSIILPTYNDSSFLNQTINSILSQNYKMWELIVINDGSTDNTDKIIRKYLKADKRIVYINHKKNMGVTIRLNEGIKIAKGSYIARIDGDDIWSDNKKLSTQINFLEANITYVLVGSWAKAVTIENKYLFDLTYPTEDKNIRSKMLLHNCFIHSSVVFRTDAVSKIGGYDTNFQYAQDYKLILELGTIGKLYNIPKFMVKYRLNPNGISQKKYKKQVDDTIKILKDYKNLYPYYQLSIILWKLRKYSTTWIRFGSIRKLKSHLRL